MNHQEIREMQRLNPEVNRIQLMINNGSIWSMEGSIGRQAMAMLEEGMVMLPKHPTRDSYGNLLPSRDWLKPGSKGTFQNCVRYYNSVKNRATE